MSNLHYDLLIALNLVDKMSEEELEELRTRIAIRERTLSAADGD